MKVNGSKVTLKQISDLTGYSLATVSNVLRHKKEVNKETQRIIMSAASSLGYVFGARIEKINLVMFHKTGLVLRETPLIQALIEGVIQEGMAHNTDIVISYIDRRESDYKNKVSEILGEPDSGIILIATEMDLEDLELFKYRLGPLVVVDACFPAGSVPYVLMENTRTMSEAVDYLVSKGHHEIGFIGSTVQIQNFRDREEGFFLGMRRNGIAVNPEYRISVGPTIESAKISMMQYLSQNHKLATAYVAVNDIIAFGVICALKDCGIEVPEQVSVIGFDNMPFGAVSAPKLTTFDVSKKELGITAAQLLFLQEKERVYPAVISLRNTLVERESVKDISGKN